MVTRAALVISLLAALSIAPAIGAEGEPVKIGLLTDMSGTFSANTGAGSVLAAQMAIDDFGGQVIGRPIQLVSAAHQNKPDVGSARLANGSIATGLGLPDGSTHRAERAGVRSDRSLPLPLVTTR